MIVAPTADEGGDFDGVYSSEFAHMDTKSSLGHTTAPIVDPDAEVGEDYDNVYATNHQGRDTASVLGDGAGITVQPDANTVDEEFGAVFDDRFNGRSTAGQLGDGIAPIVDHEATEATFAFKGTLGLEHAGKRSRSNFLRSNAPLVHPEADEKEGFDGVYDARFEGRITETQLGDHVGPVVQVEEEVRGHVRTLAEKTAYDIVGQSGTQVPPLAAEHRGVPPWTRAREGTLPWAVDMLRRHFTVAIGGTASMFSTFKRAQFMAGVSKAKSKRITHTQFRQIIEMAGMELEADLLKQVFDVFDRDGDNAIDLEDFKVAVFGDTQMALTIPAVEIIAGRKAHRKSTNEPATGQLTATATQKEEEEEGAEEGTAAAAATAAMGLFANSMGRDGIDPITGKAMEIVEPVDPLLRPTMRAGTTWRASTTDQAAAEEGDTGLLATTEQLFRHKLVHMHKGGNRPMKTFLTFRRFCNTPHNEITESEFKHGLELAGLHEHIDPTQAGVLFRSIDLEGNGYVDFNSLTNYLFGQSPNDVKEYGILEVSRMINGGASGTGDDAVYTIVDGEVR